MTGIGSLGTVQPGNVQPDSVNINFTYVNIVFAPCLCYVILQIVTLALLEINLFLVTTVLSQEIQMVNFGFRTSGDSILLKFVLLRQS